MRRVLLVALLGTSANGGVARAQEPAPPARRPVAELVAEGEALAGKGRVAESLPLFREAAAREPTARHVCLVALTYFRVGRLPEARLRLDAAATAEGERPEWCADAVLGRDVDRALGEGAYAPVEVTVVGAGVGARAKVEIAVLAPGEVMEAPGVVWLPWGTQRVVAGERAVEVVVEGKERIRVRIEVGVARGPGGRDGGRGEGAGMGEGIRIGQGQGQGQGREGKRRSVLGWTMVAVGVAAVAGGGGFHWAAARSRAEAEELYAGPAFDARAEQFETRRTAAIGLYVGGVVIGAIGAWLVAR